MEREIYKLINSKDFDGYIYCKSGSSMDNNVMKYIESFLKRTNKFVMVADDNRDERFDYTQSDDFDDFRCLVDHLIEVHDYKKIYCLTGTKGLFQSEERLKDYFYSMKKHGLYYDEKYYEYGDFWTTGAKEYAKKIVAGVIERPEAIVCGNDTMAYALIECFANNEIHVPSDIAVTGYDGWTMSDHANIALTTFLRDNFQLGADCMRRLYRQITGKLCKRVTKRENGFILGCSCGCKNIPMTHYKVQSQEKMYNVYREHMDYSDMIFDIYSQSSVNEIFRKAERHSYMIYDAKYMNFFSM